MSVQLVTKWLIHREWHGYRFNPWFWATGLGGTGAVSKFSKLWHTAAHTHSIMDFGRFWAKNTRTYQPIGRIARNIQHLPVCWVLHPPPLTPSQHVPSPTQYQTFADVQTGPSAQAIPPHLSSSMSMLTAAAFLMLLLSAVLKYYNGCLPGTVCLD